MVYDKMHFKDQDYVFFPQSRTTNTQSFICMNAKVFQSIITHVIVLFVRFKNVSKAPSTNIFFQLFFDFSCCFQI